MKTTLLFQCRQLASILAALGLLAFCISFVPQKAMALDVNVNLFSRSLPSDATILAKESPRQLPAAIVRALRQDVSKRTGIQPQTIQVIESAPKNWPNGCLGLAKPDEMCTQSLVNGWRVTLSNGSRRWVYRTNASGNVFRLEPSDQR